MSDALSGCLLVWLTSYLLHSTFLISLAFALDFCGLLRSPRIAETVWRCAMFGGMLTASLQCPCRAH